MGTISLLLGFTVIALVAGFVANLIVGKDKGFQNWELFVAGIIGSFVGGGILNLLINGNFDLGISGLIGSTLGAIIVLAVWGWLRMNVLKDRMPG
jgi:uncharacterized membrane protein YeaQ/YmgE (transglycosylase-associated protein family)